MAKSIAGNQPVFTPEWKSPKMDVHIVYIVSLLSYVEDSVADWAVGEDVEALRQMMVDFEIDEEFFENLCEDQ